MNTRPFVIAALLVLSPAVARADDAQDHMGKGMRFYNVQDWPSALREYKAAYEIDPKPETLWAIAQVQRLSGDCRSAILTYKAFMRTASATAANAAGEFIKKCESDLTAQQQAVEAATAPPPPPPPVVKQVVVAPPPQPPVPIEHKTHGPWILDPLADVLGIIALGGLATGAVFLTLGNVGMGATASATPYQTYDRDVDSARTQQQVGVGLGIGGGVFAVLAIWRFVAIASRNANEAHVPPVAITPQPGGFLAGTTLRF